MAFGAAASTKVMPFDLSPRQLKAVQNKQPLFKLNPNLHYTQLVVRPILLYPPSSTTIITHDDNLIAVGTRTILTFTDSTFWSFFL